MFAKLAILASFMALETNAQGSNNNNQNQQDEEKKELWRQRNTVVTDPLVPYASGTTAPTDTQSLLMGEYLTRANTDSGEYYFGFEMTLTTAQPGHTYCQYASMVNDSEIKEGIK